MSCGSCTTGSCGSTGSPKGCKSNGDCQSGGCNKFNTFDWLSDMEIPGVDPFLVVEVKFKAGRKEFFRNKEGLELCTNDAVVVQAKSGYHIGYVSLQGELVRLQMKRKKVKDDDKLNAIYRLASDVDLAKAKEAQNRDSTTMYRARTIVQELKLAMKLTDVEYQADNSKATFYYSAESRVDFRELIKMLASEFSIRIEMKQISIRQEAGRLGGIGSCGRELCCSTWISDFKTVNTGAARYQNLSLNPSKLSGQCGRLKCCLNYELDTYLDALVDIPKISKYIQVERGNARLQKTDIFKKTMWFSFENDTNWYPVSTERVKEIQELNKKGESPALDPIEKEVDKKPKRQHRGISNEKRITTSKEMENDSLDRFSDVKEKKEPRTRRRNSSRERDVSADKRAGSSKKKTSKSRGNSSRKGETPKGKDSGKDNPKEKENIKDTISKTNSPKPQGNKLSARKEKPQHPRKNPPRRNQVKGNHLKGNEKNTGSTIVPKQETTEKKGNTRKPKRPQGRNFFKKNKSGERE